MSTGAWTEYLLYDEGRWHEAHCERLPTVCSVLSTLRECSRACRLALPSAMAALWLTKTIAPAAVPYVC